MDGWMDGRTKGEKREGAMKERRDERRDREVGRRQKRSACVGSLKNVIKLWLLFKEWPRLSRRMLQ